LPVGQGRVTEIIDCCGPDAGDCGDERVSRQRRRFVSEPRCVVVSRRQCAARSWSTPEARL